MAFTKENAAAAQAASIEARRNKKAASTSPYGRDLVAGRPAQLEEELIAQDKAAVDAQLDTHVQEAEITRLRAELAAERAQQAARDVLHRKWVLGDYSDLDALHPFEITIFTEEDANKNLPVYVAVNGNEFRIPRGVPFRVPRNIIEVLAGTKIKGMQKVPDALGNVQEVPILESRFHFQARPIYDS
jgi:hypothetical protein